MPAASTFKRQVSWAIEKGIIITSVLDKILSHIQPPSNSENVRPLKGQGHCLSELSLYPMSGTYKTFNIYLLAE